MRTAPTRPTRAALAALAAAALLAACGGSSSGGSDDTSAPTITTQPASATVGVGGTASLSVTAAGGGTLSYQWYKDAAALSGATAATYSIASATAADAGSYAVVVSSAYGSATSDAAVLTVTSATADAWDLETGANPADLVESTAFAHTVAIDLSTLAVTSSSAALVVGAASGGVTPLTLDGATVVTVAQEAYGLTVTSALPEGTHATFALSGSFAGTVTFHSAESFALRLDGPTIASPDGPAINVQSEERTFVLLPAGTTSTLSDSSTWSTRFLASGAEMDLKATFFSEGPLVISGTGALRIDGRKKHALCSDAHVRLREGTVTLTSAKKDGLRANDAFVMDGGTLSVTTASGAGKGIKVEGREDATTPLGFIAVNAGALTISSYDKAMTASWESAEDGTTATLTDDPDPFVTINGGTLTISTFGTPFEDTDLSDGDASLSPEGIESKSVLTVNGGTLAVATTDDALNAGSALVINGGRVYARASANDAIDSNGTLTIAGGVVVADGAGGAEGGLDCDENRFTITGGTFVGIGGRNSTPTASVATENAVSLRNAGAALLVIEDDAGGVAFAFQVPEASAAVLLGSPGLATGTRYTVWSGGALGSWSEAFHGLYLGAASHTGGTQGASFTIASRYTAL